MRWHTSGGEIEIAWKDHIVVKGLASILVALFGRKWKDDNGGEGGSMNRIGVNSPECSKDSILVFQGPTTRLPNGIPTYTVSIENVCLSGPCTFSDIHMSCGWFSSARLVDPKVFRRLAYDDCLVNDGGPFNPGDTLSFQYANTFAYPLSVTSLSC
ncbi:TPD1 protein homolog 1 [Striga hermonthica]|uniref:TPD1 protein homolog 1 n=1 Tax=Striga hermonthica TaxID=68872 RepID=A0A9N7MXK0_STRHE|nr:TPD1 protein homolog 1 [Striga hermonthica]